MHLPRLYIMHTSSRNRNGATFRAELGVVAGWFCLGLWLPEVWPWGKVGLLIGCLMFPA